MLDESIQYNLKNYNFHKMYKDLSNFCSLDLSSFYFDIRKDVLYCDDINSKKRKECIIVLNIILECLLKWFAPIFVFTTEEIYKLINKKEESIHQQNFASIPVMWKNVNLDNKWKDLYRVKQIANIAIEEKRTSKEIGSSLEANIEIYLNKKTYDLLNGLDLSEYFITSKAVRKINEDQEEDIIVKVKKAVGSKCNRCWKILDSKCERCLKVTKDLSN